MKFKNSYRYSSLEVLENNKWPMGRFETRLIKRCYELRKIPLNDFTIEDLRLMIGQQIGLEYLIPVAIEKLKENIWAEGDFFEGDLLQNLLKVNGDFWKDHKDLCSILHQLLLGNEEELDERKIDSSRFYTNVR